MRNPLLSASTLDTAHGWSSWTKKVWPSKCQNVTLFSSRILYFQPSISQAKNGMAFHAEPISIKGKWSRKKSSDNFLRQHSIIRFVGFSSELWFIDCGKEESKSLKKNHWIERLKIWVRKRNSLFNEGYIPLLICDFGKSGQSYYFYHELSLNKTQL